MLLFDHVDHGSWVYDSRGLAYILGSDGDTILSVGSPRVVVPRVDYVDEATALLRMDAVIWASVGLRDIPCTSVDGALECFRAQVRMEPTMLYYKPQGLAEEAARVVGLACQLSTRGETDILVGLPDPEVLGFHLRDTFGTEGFVVFPENMAVVRIVV